MKPAPIQSAPTVPIAADFDGPEEPPNQSRPAAKRMAPNIVGGSRASGSFFLSCSLALSKFFQKKG